MSVKSKIHAVINHKDFLYYLLALTLSTAFIGFALSSIVLGIFCFFGLRYAYLNKIGFKLNTALFLFTLLYVLCCVSYFWTVNQALTLKGIGRLSILLVLPLVFGFIPKPTVRSLQIVMNYFTLSNVLLGIFFLIVAIINYIKHGNPTVFTYHDFVEILDLNAIYVSVYCTISYFFLLSKQSKKSIDYLGLFLLLIFILLLSSKTIIATLLLGNIIYFIFYKGIRTLKTTKSIGILLIVILVLTFASREVVNRISVEIKANLEEVLHKEKFNRVYPWTGTSIRLLQLRNLKEQIEEDNIFWKGFGLFASRENLRERHLAFNTYYGYHEYNYHNMYAQIFSELGIFALLLLLGLLGLGVKKSFQTKSFIMFMFYFLMIMIFISESFLWVHRGVLFFTLFCCIFCRIDLIKKAIN